MNAEFTHKLGQVRSVIKANKAAGALLGLQANFAWLACGGEAHVALISDRAAGQLLVTPKGFFLLANGIEMPRLQDEALRGLGAGPLSFDWFEDDDAANALRKVIDPAKVISDTGDLGTRAMPDAFAQLRYSLHPAEIKRYRELARRAEAAMNAACRALKPGMSEFEGIGILAEHCWESDVTPVVLLAAFDERIRRYRHPLPTTKKLKRHAMLVLCARQGGLIASVTRLVHFGKLPAELRKKHDAVCAVDAAFIASTRVGTPVREVFRRGVAAYVEQGFADEWKLHHQGGPCGYRPRDYVGTPTAPGVVLENQAFAWNPSITGTKGEDTILATSKGPQILTAAQDWPMLEVEHHGETFLRPDILIR
ncbi:MAG TPA: M24 family metallopeptidase [Verrucomicrobiae bacterium]|nr:M24 family metallopeptidase [Verrucomicrobiae bacterium]